MRDFAVRDPPSVPGTEKQSQNKVTMMVSGKGQPSQTSQIAGRHLIAPSLSRRKGRFQQKLDEHHSYREDAGNRGLA